MSKMDVMNALNAKSSKPNPFAKKGKPMKKGKKPRRDVKADKSLVQDIFK